MSKLAIFVEGQTEQLFVERLLREVADSNQLAIECRQAALSKTGQRSFRLLRASPPASVEQAPNAHNVLIVDCGGESTVKSDIRDNYDRLVASGYTTILGIRDVYPQFTRDDIPKLREMLSFKMKTSPVRPAFMLGVMEIEAWFLAEHTHFQNVDSRLTLARIVEVAGFDPSTCDTQERPCPSDDLHAIYSDVGMAYKKKRSQVQRTVRHLDYARLYVDIRDRIPDLEEFVVHCDAFLEECKEPS